MKAIAVQALTVRYPEEASPALDGLTLDVGTGEFWGVLGPNGAGKTTLLHVLCGLLRPDSGTVELFGEPVRKGVRSGALAICPQDLALYSMLSARENLHLFGTLAGLSGDALERAVGRSLEDARLTAQADRRVSRFSGGMKRRLNLAIALLHEPRLVLLDEPTVGVDLQSRALIHETLRQLGDRGTTVVCTTHYIEEAEKLCANVAIIDHGRILEAGPTERLKSAGGRYRCRVQLSEAVPDSLVQRLRSADLEVSTRDGTKLVLTARQQTDLMERTLSACRDEGVELRHIEMSTGSLEDRFLDLTGREMRD